MFCFCSVLKWEKGQLTLAFANRVSSNSVEFLYHPYQHQYELSYTAVNDVYLYKVPNTWNSFHFSFKMTLVYFLNPQ